MKILGIIILAIIIPESTGFTGDNRAYVYKLSTYEHMLHGPYSSMYINGNRKAEGTFYRNQRQGIWKIYDTTGVLIIERHYSNSFTFEIEKSEYRLTSQSASLIPEKYDLLKNDSGYINYPPVKYQEVVVSKRIWRNVEPNDGNSVFFKDNAMMKAIIPHLLNQKITVYGPNDDEFTIELNSQQIKDACRFASFNIAGFKIKEEWFYSSKMQMSETRILGICPYIEIDGVKTDLFWLYYPNIRNILAQVDVSFGREEGLIENMEDVFFFRRFSGEIYKESNLHDKSIRDYTPVDEVSKEAERIEVSMIEMEHDIWLKNVRN